MEGVMTTNGRKPRRFVHSLAYDSYFERDSVYYRCPNHYNPVRRELALQVGFPDINFMEERDYAYRLRPLLKTEVVIPDTLYFYDFRPKTLANKVRAKMYERWGWGR
jgi:hypothetical protein